MLTPDIITDLIPAGRKNRPGLPMNPQYVCIHETANETAGADALSHAKYIKSDSAANLPASWHYTVDDKRAVRHLPDTEIAYHAGDGSGPGNRSSIGIEICVNSDGDFTKARDNAAELAASLMTKYKLPIGRLVQHNYWSGKNCPARMRSIPGAWDRFVEAVQKRMQPAAPKPASDAIPVIVGGVTLAGRMIDGVVYAPVRALCEELGIKVAWDGKTVKIS